MSLANRMALASPKVRAVCVEANEFPYLSQRFRVRGVPHTVINRSGGFLGALPELDFVAATLELAGIPIAEHHDHEDGPSTELNATSTELNAGS